MIKLTNFSHLVIRGTSKFWLDIVKIGKNSNQAHISKFLLVHVYGIL